MIGARQTGPWRHRRAGFTVLELTLALGVLIVAMITVAQVAAWGLNERYRTALRQDMLEHATNVLERARSLPWESLTPEWAAGQKLPEPLAQRLARLSVRVEPDASRPLIKRVIIEVRAKDVPGGPDRVVQLVGLFGRRSAPVPGGIP